MGKKAVCFLFILALFTTLFSVSAVASTTVYTTVPRTAVVFSSEVDLASDLRAIVAEGDNLYATFMQGRKRVLKLDRKTGETLAVWENPSQYYIKGIDTDDRGYVYLTATPGGQTTDGYLIILDADLRELKTVPIVRDVVFGLNGVTVSHRNDRYTAYVILNYGPNSIAAYDVTALGSIAPDLTFGDNGVCDFVALTGYEFAEALYLSVDADGALYVTGNVMRLQTKGDSVTKISADGKVKLAATAIDQAYGCALWNGCVLVSRNAGAASEVMVLSTDTLRTVQTFAAASGNGTYTEIDVSADHLYIGLSNAEADRILSCNLVPNADKGNVGTTDGGWMTFCVIGGILSSLCFLAVIGKKRFGLSFF